MHKLDLRKIRGKKVLGIGAHPDDLEFCAGGTLLLLSEQNTISTLVVTDGRMGTHDMSLDHEAVKRLRMEENRKAAKFMGVTRDLYWDYPDFSLKKYETNFRRKLLLFLLTERPDIVITFDPWGRYEPAIHPDHRVVSWAVVESVLAGTLPLYLKKIGYNGRFLSPKPQIWLMAPASPNVGVDVSGIWDKKWEILALHKSQFDEHVVFEEMKRKVGRVLCGEPGKAIGCQYAEGFRIMDLIPED
jgi:LmbE family N-acetylglucosaminyl deacetylase